MIREKALRLLSQEIPHGIAVVIDAMKVRRHGHIMDIDATIVCERDSHKGIIIGKQGSPDLTDEELSHGSIPHRFVSLADL